MNAAPIARPMVAASSTSVSVTEALSQTDKVLEAAHSRADVVLEFLHGPRPLDPNHDAIPPLSGIVNRTVRNLCETESLADKINRIGNLLGC